MRPITLFTGQWADLPLATMAKKASAWGYQGLELAASGDHLDIDRAAEDRKYCKKLLDTLAKNDLKVWAISNHLAGQLTCDPDDDCRTDRFAPAALAGKKNAKRKWAVEQMKKSARAAANLGVEVVTGFTGSPIWHMLYSFPPVTEDMIAAGYEFFAKTWNPIMDEFKNCGVKFALEVHPTEIAFDIYSAKRTLEAIGNRPEFGFNFDPSHLQWQMMDPVAFLKEFPNRIYHVHVKDAKLNLDGRNGILGSHITFGDQRRGWNFVSPGHGNVDFDAIIRALNQIGYDGPLSIEWEDSGMERVFGGTEACAFTKKINFSPSDVAFDDAIKNQ